MKPTLRLWLILTSLAIPMAALAVPPAEVTGVSALYKNNQIEVRWNAPANSEDIAFYRVYYSRKSILNNGGYYEDFDTVSGRLTETLIKDFPKGDSLFVSILAVNTQGEESAVFAEEAEVSLTGATPTSSGLSSARAASSSSQTVQEQMLLRLVSIENISGTGLVLTFSRSVSIPPADAVRAITITYGSGDVLGIKRIAVRGSKVTIDTEPQTANQAYTVHAAYIQGLSQNGLLELDPASAEMTFRGVAVSPAEASSSSSQSSMQTSASEPAAEVSNVLLEVEPNGKGLHTIIASFDAPENADIQGYEVRQTRDSGATYGSVQRVPATASKLRFSAVGIGEFGILIRTVYKSGETSNGMFAAVTIEPTGIIPPAPTGTPLNKSGPGIVFTLLLTGAAAGWLQVRRRWIQKAI